MSRQPVEQSTHSTVTAELPPTANSSNVSQKEDVSTWNYILNTIFNLMTPPTIDEVYSGKQVKRDYLHENDKTDHSTSAPHVSSSLDTIASTLRDVMTPPSANEIYGGTLPIESPKSQYVPDTSQQGSSNV